MLGFVPGKRRCTITHCDIHPDREPLGARPKTIPVDRHGPRQSQPSLCAPQTRGLVSVQVVAARGGAAPHSALCCDMYPSQGMYFAVQRPSLICDAVRLLLYMAVFLPRVSDDFISCITINPARVQSLCLASWPGRSVLWADRLLLLWTWAQDVVCRSSNSLAAALTGPRSLEERNTASRGYFV